MPARARRAGVALALLLAACGGGASPGGVPLDPSRPDDALLIEGLARYDAANAAAASARAATDPAARTALEAQAITGYRAAAESFQALPVRFPASIRVDNAVYLEGRCAYEVATLTDLRADFVVARDLLDAAAALHPASALQDSVAYFGARSRYRIASLDAATPGASTAAVLATFGAARDGFDRSLAASASGPWADNAAYFRARCDFQAGSLLLSPLEPGALPPAPGTPGFAEAIAHLREAQVRFAAIGPSSPTWYDNARYYLGRSHFEEPLDPTLPDGRARRAAGLGSAIAAFGQVIALPGASAHAPEARYWRGRSFYARETYGATPAEKDADLAAAGADFRAVPPAAGWRDNALSWLSRSYVNFSAPFCTAARPGDPGLPLSQGGSAPASACGARAALLDLVATDPAFAASPYPARTDAYLSSKGCACP